MIRRILAAAAVLAALCPPAHAQVKAGGELAVNTYTTSTQWFSSVGVEPDGDFVVVWNSLGQDGGGSGVFGQRYDRNGTRRGSEFQVNTYTTEDQNGVGRSAVAADRRGDFVVTWASYGQDGDAWGVFARRFQANGTGLGVEFQVNTYTPDYQGSLAGYTTVGMGMDPRGNFVVVWSSYGQDGDGTGIFGQRFDAFGTRIGGEFQVNTVTTGYQAAPDVAMNASGDFVVAWSGPDGSGYGVFARRFAANGSPVGAEFRVNTFTAGNQSYLILEPPSVALSDSGSFAVVWDSGGQDGSSYGVFGQAFTAAGAPSGSEFRVNTYTTGGQSLTGASADAVGNFVVTWQSDTQDGSSYGVFGQRFLSTGARRGAEFQVNTFTTSFQGVPDVDLDEVGNFEISWHGLTPIDADNGVAAQRFGGLFPTALRVNTGGNGVLEPGEAAADVRPTWLNATGVTTTFAGALTNPGGPAGGVPVIVDGTANYGSPPNGTAVECTDCYAVTVPSPPARPTLHWDATAVETIAPDAQGQQKIWRLHVGNSFTDVAPSTTFYRFVETLLHNGITGGCGPDTYCPLSAVSREQMAVFVLVAKEGPGYQPIACTTPVFTDVPASSPFCRFIEELVRRGVVAGCGPNTYCPLDSVTREQMAVFVLRTLDPTLVPPPCVPPNTYPDVPETSPFCPWIEELTRRGVVTGCGGGNYCPSAPVTRDQMGVFLSATFGLTLYGP